MEFKYARIADYAGDGGRGKMTVVGIFDTLFYRPEAPNPVSADLIGRRWYGGRAAD